MNPSKQKTKPIRIVCERDSRNILESSEAPHTKIFKIDYTPNILTVAQIAAENYLKDVNEESYVWILHSNTLIGVYSKKWAQIKNPWIGPKQTIATNSFLAPDGKIHIHFELFKNIEPEKILESIRLNAKGIKIQNLNPIS